MNTRCCFTYLLFFLVFVICSCDKVINDNDDHKQDSTFVSIDQAQESLLSFMANIGLDTKANERVISERYSVGGLVETKSKEDESPLVYVFNFSNNQGYALVSGDTRTPSILCLIESGHFSKEDQETNVGLKMLLTNIDTYCRMLQGFPIENSDGK